MEQSINELFFSLTPQSFLDIIDTILYATDDFTNHAGSYQFGSNSFSLVYRIVAIKGFFELRKILRVQIVERYDCGLVRGPLSHCKLDRTKWD